MLPKLTIHAAVACGLASLAPGAGAAPVATTSTVFGKSTLQLACGPRAPSCHYLILTSLCNEKMGKPPTVSDCINNPSKL